MWQWQGSKRQSRSMQSFCDLVTELVQSRLLHSVGQSLSQAGQDSRDREVIPSVLGKHVTKGVLGRYDRQQSVF